MPLDDSQSPAPRTNLSAEATSFVGREEVLERLSARLAGGERLLTVLGPAGVGKTRIARRLGMRESVRFPGGVWFCDLTCARDQEQMVLAVACALELPQPGARSLAAQAERVGLALAGRPPALLILDNFEQLPAEAATLVAEWLGRAPRTSWLVTSRERLHLHAEALFELEPLGLPADGGDPGASEAVRLFRERARVGGAPLDPDDEATIGAIVRRLDGMPLAIELAAARVRMLGLAGLDAGLTDRFALLSGGGRDRTARQATLWGALEWSWELCTPAEQEAFAACGVFQGGFDLEAAEAVVPAPALALVEALCDKSLVRVLPRAGGAAVRFQLYESLAEFAARKLGTASRGRQEAHARHYLRLAEDLASQIHGPRGLEARRRLEVERDNLMAVIERSNDSIQAARALCALDPVLAAQGPYERHLALLDQALAQAERLPERLRAHLLADRGNVRRMRGRTLEALDDLQAALDLGARLDDAGLEGAIAHDLGIAWHDRDELQAAERCLTRALALARQIGDRRDEGRALGSLAILLQERGRFEEAQTHYEWALVLLGEAGDERSVGVFLSNLGDLHLEHERPTEARASYERALELMRRVGDRRVEAAILGNLGAVAQAAGNLAEAAELRGRAVQTLEEVGDVRLAGVFEGYLGTVAHERGDSKGAAALYRKAICRAEAAQSPRYEGLFRACLGALCAANGRPQEARIELGRAKELWAPLGDRFLLLTWELHAAQLHAVSPDLPAPAEVLAAARRPAPPTAEAPWHGPSLAAQSDEVRFAIRALEQALGARPAASVEEAATLVVDPEGRGFQVPGGSWVDLGRRRSLRLLVFALAQARLHHPGAGIDLDGLLEAGWPGERMLPEAGANRVYVALATLRKMGLRQVLVSRDDGYLLDPRVQMALRAPP